MNKYVSDDKRKTGGTHKIASDNLTNDVANGLLCDDADQSSMLDGVSS